MIEDIDDYLKQMHDAFVWGCVLGAITGVVAATIITWAIMKHACT